MIAKFSLGRLIRKVPKEQDVPVLRRADSHPDAPARRPIRASEEFGKPLPMTAPAPAPGKRRIAKPEARDLPADLETRLAALDPAAIPDTPREPARPVTPLASRPQTFDPGERFETFELTPIRRGVTTKVAAAPARPEPKPGESPPSIGTLLERLERKTGRDIRSGASVEETLGMLRKLATR